MLLLSDNELAERRRVTGPGGPLAPLYDSLAAELEPLLTRPWEIPTQKALLSRAGGRCEKDATTLDFDPWSPRDHRCPKCGTVHRGEVHDRWWVWHYQLWLAERAVHAALFHALRGEEQHARLARDILRGLAEKYLTYPNKDNVLGPTRPFFSTYLESIWLLQVCVAADLLEFTGDTPTASAVCDRIVEPSRAIIAQFDEEGSNRQVWNNAALLAAASLLGDKGAIDERLHSGWGLVAHLTRTLLPDGTWFEGENYHQFALGGLWYGVTIAETRGVPIEPPGLKNYEKAFEAPFVTALPDFTMPSRKDSQYAVSLRQWRLAELTELGYARTKSSVLAGALTRCYEPGHTRGDTARSRSTADAERNTPSTALTRADLGWRALLHAVPELKPSAAGRPRSTLLESQGLAIFRRDDDVYVSLDYGEYGGGHGHPDRLNLTLAQRGTRWLDDMGTGSYVDPSLHWYRSTLAHNAPLVNGRSQPEANGTLHAYDERGGIGWIVARFRIPDGDVTIERAVVVAPDYLIDELRWTARASVRVELPWHLQASTTQVSFQPLKLDGGTGLEDGFNAVRGTYATQLVAERPLLLEGKHDDERLFATLVSDVGALLYLASAPGQPATEERPFYLLRGEGKSGRFRAVLAWTKDAPVVTLADESLTVEVHGERHVHKRDDAGWHVELHAGGARSSIDLAPPRDNETPPPREKSRVRPNVSGGIARRPVPGGWWSEWRGSGEAAVVGFKLAEREYRRTDQSWSDAGCPNATIAFAADERALHMFAIVTAGDRRFVGADAVNTLDNEHPDTMGAGLQFYVRGPTGRGGWMLIPDAGETVRVRAIDGWAGLPAPTARWRATADGYEVRAELPIPRGSLDLGVGVIVNETTMDRVRRRGQLVLGGAHGGFGYLRGDRHDESFLIRLGV